MAKPFSTIHLFTPTENQNNPSHATALATPPETRNPLSFKKDQHIAFPAGKVRRKSQKRDREKVVYPSMRGVFDRIFRTTLSLASSRLELRSSNARGSPMPAIKAQASRKRPSVTGQLRRGPLLPPPPPPPTPPLPALRFAAETHEKAEFDTCWVHVCVYRYKDKREGFFVGVCCRYTGGLIILRWERRIWSFFIRGSERACVLVTQRSEGIFFDGPLEMFGAAGGFRRLLEWSMSLFSSMVIFFFCFTSVN